MLNKRLLWSVAVVSLGVLLMAGYNRPYRWWPINDMSEQISIKPYHEGSLRTPPEGTMSVNGYEPVRGRLDPIKGENINPYAPTEESIAKGKALVQTFCATCHGIDFGLNPENKAILQTGIRPDTGGEFTAMPSQGVMLFSIANYDDEYIYRTISNGAAIMKRLDYHIPPDERWHVVNYVRTLIDEYKARNPQ